MKYKLREQGFAGFATWLDMTPADSDMFGMPDGDSVIQLRGIKEIAWSLLQIYIWMVNQLKHLQGLHLKANEKASKKSLYEVRC